MEHLQGLFITRRQAADYLGVSVQRVAQLVTAGKLTGKTLGKIHLIDYSSVQLRAYSREALKITAKRRAMEKAIRASGADCAAPDLIPCLAPA